MDQKNDQELKNPILEDALDEVRGYFGTRLDEIQVERAVLGLFFTGVRLTGGWGGLCATPLKEIPEAVCCPSSARAMPKAGVLVGRTAAACLEDLFSPHALRRTVALAVLNALTSCWQAEAPRTDIEVLQNADAFDVLELDRYKKTVVVGALVPLLKRLIKEGADFVVLEKDERTLKGAELEHFRPAEDFTKVLAEADLAVISGTTLLNNSLEGLLKAAKPGAEILLTGPSAGIPLPPLLKRGVTLVGGIEVTDIDALLDLLAEGGSGYHFFGKQAVRTVMRLKK